MLLRAARLWVGEKKGIRPAYLTFISPSRPKRGKRAEPSCSYRKPPSKMKKDQRKGVRRRPIVTNLGRDCPGGKEGEKSEKNKGSIKTIS